MHALVHTRYLLLLGPFFRLHILLVYSPSLTSFRSFRPSSTALHKAQVHQGVAQHNIPMAEALHTFSFFLPFFILSGLLQVLHLGLAFRAYYFCYLAIYLRSAVK